MAYQLLIKYHNCDPDIIYGGTDLENVKAIALEKMMEINPNASDGERISIHTIPDEHNQFARCVGFVDTNWDMVDEIRQSDTPNPEVFFIKDLINS